MKKEDTMKRHHRHIIRLALPMIAIAMLLGTHAPAQVMTRQLVCPGPIPSGWIKVDASSSPADCGGNAWVIEPYDNKSVGSAMIVCADQPTPPGWETVGQATSTGQCNGADFSVDNVKSIRRIS
jgi:hypothetical protein